MIGSYKHKLQKSAWRGIIICISKRLNSEKNLRPKQNHIPQKFSLKNPTFAKIILILLALYPPLSVIIDWFLINRNYSIGCV